MTVVVVGYGPGISHATAARFGAGGQVVALIGRNPDRLAAGVDRLARAGVEAAGYPGDASRPETLREVLAAIRADHGPIATIIWTAYRNGAVSDVLDARPEDLAEVFQVGVAGLLTAVQTCLDDLRATPGAAVRGCDSGVNGGRPRRSLRSPPATGTGAGAPVASLVAALRNALARIRSSCRTPASRV